MRKRQNKKVMKSKKDRERRGEVEKLGFFPFFLGL